MPRRTHKYTHADRHTQTCRHTHKHMQAYTYAHAGTHTHTRRNTPTHIHTIIHTHALTHARTNNGILLTREHKILSLGVK